MAALSKPETPEERQTRISKVIKALSWSFFLGVTALCTPLQVEPEIITKLYKGNLASAATAITSMSALAGLLEFALNPSMGSMSDVIGRRPFFIFGPLIVAVSNALVALQGGTSRNLVLLNAILRKAGATFGGSVATMAVLTDLCKGNEFSMNFSKVFGMAGFGVIMGPLAATTLQKMTGSSPRSVYLLTSLFALIQLYVNYNGIPETRQLITEEEEVTTAGATSTNTAKPLQFKGFVSPFAFTKLFTKTKELTKICLAASLPSFCEGKNINDLNILWLRNNAGLNPSDIGAYATLWGCSALGSGILIMPYLMKHFGVRATVTLTTATTAMSTLVSSFIPSLGNGSHSSSLFWTYVSFGFLIPGINSGYASGIKGWAASHAMAAGFTSGEFAGYYSNLRAITTTLAPLIYGRIYSSFSGSNRGGQLAWWMATFLGCILPTLIWKSIPIDRLENPKKEEIEGEQEE